MHELLIGIETDSSKTIPEWSSDTEIPGIGKIRPVQPLGFDNGDLLLFALSFATSVSANVIADWITDTLRKKGHQTVIIGHRKIELETDEIRIIIEEELKTPKKIRHRP